ncbi:MAG: DUF4124 domain-containing protein [Burkholderiales bacterium]|jgi:hypothetical protein|nr:DUF4124 domain-containing protein [Burkholderiales bacterium]
MALQFFPLHGFARLLVAVLALVLSASVSAALYKSVGPDGKVTYSDKPPMNVKEAEKTERIRDTSSPGDPEAVKKLAEQEADFQKRMNERQAGEQKAVDEKKERADLLRRCQDARTAVRQYRDTGMTLYRAGEKEGERAALDMETRLKEADRVEREMKEAGCD